MDQNQSEHTDTEAAQSYEPPAVTERTAPEDLLVWAATTSPVVCL